jgi:hypothetical protein
VIRAPAILTPRNMDTVACLVPRKLAPDFQGCYSNAAHHKSKLQDAVSKSSKSVGAEVGVCGIFEHTISFRARLIEEALGRFLFDAQVSGESPSNGRTNVSRNSE